MMNSVIENCLNPLKGKYLKNIGRAANIIWLNFIDKAVEKKYEGNYISSGLLSLHVQCPCRMMNQEMGKILFASSDMYVPNSSVEWSEEFIWDIPGNNLFDEKSHKWLLSNEKLIVDDYELSTSGDLKLKLSNGNVFEVFINTSTDDECWRLFVKKIVKDHFVVTGQNVAIL